MQAFSELKIGPIKKLFIANRGEILARIARSAKNRSITTVCISDRQELPQFLSGLIDEKILVPEENTALYLNMDTLLNFAKGAGCDGLHPGFGFLSENYEFAEKVIKAGINWVGPSPSSIYAMADKGRARKLAIGSKVPCTLGLENFRIEDGPDPILKLVEKTGWPLMIKAALGGGGKGMRIVHEEKELADALQRASSEALKSFGDPSLIVEPYIAKSRHVEVQVFGDTHGNIHIFGDRDCSLQRRHQKVLEEAPAPNISAATRASLHNAAKQLAQKVNYVSAGTVEFLLEPQTENFYFLEMNTRLQVEHPVTENIFGVDLVELQLKIATGEKIDLKALQAIEPQGHSIEVRIYAEDVDAGFLPSAGKIFGFIPDPDPKLRWEVGLDTVDEVTSRFDPMIAKLIVHGVNRLDAFQILKKGLDQTFIAGVKNNKEFLSFLCGHPLILEGPQPTSFLGENSAKLVEEKNRERKLIEGVQRIDHYFQVIFNPQEYPKRKNPVAEIFRGTTLNSCFSEVDKKDSFRIKLEKILWDSKKMLSYGKRGFMGSGSIQPGLNFIYAQGIDEDTRLHRFLSFGGPVFEKTEGLGDILSDDLENQSTLTSPVPGKVIKIFVKKGDSVEKGQTCAVLESMKMEFEIKVVNRAKISEILVELNEQVSANKTLFKLG